MRRLRRLRLQAEPRRDTHTEAPTLTPEPASADPFLGQLVVTVREILRVRSEPGVSADPFKDAPLLRLGTELELIGGPGQRLGHAWYEVTPVSFVMRDGVVRGSSMERNAMIPPVTVCIET